MIENDSELARLTAILQSLDRLDPELTPEESALDSLLSRLIDDYDEKVELPDVPPHNVIAFLMQQRGLRQADLVPIFGSRSIASEVITGKREPSKAHIRKLSEFFRLSPAAFF